MWDLIVSVPDLAYLFTLFNVGSWREPQSTFPESPWQDGVFISPGPRLG